MCAAAAGSPEPRRVCGARTGRERLGGVVPCRVQGAPATRPRADAVGLYGHIGRRKVESAGMKAKVEELSRSKTLSGCPPVPITESVVASF